MGSPGNRPPFVPRPPKPPAKKGLSSRVVKVGTVVGLSALVLAFCAAQDDYDEVTADCVDTSDWADDGSYAVVDDDYCEENRTGYRGSHGAFVWYYGGVRTGLRVARGTTVRPPGAQITSRSGKTTIQRGGFGGRGGGGS